LRVVGPSYLSLGTVGKNDAAAERAGDAEKRRTRREAVAILACEGRSEVGVGARTWRIFS
jgi:hypothetical protein